MKIYSNFLLLKYLDRTLLLLLVLSQIIALVHSDENPPTVKTPLGTVIGHYKTSYKGRRYEVYEGIPYAKPPMGSLRFEVH